MALHVIEKEIVDADITIIKESRCESLSGRSTLGYSIGKISDESILIRIDSNSGTGKFTSTWLRLDTILSLLADLKEPFAGNALAPLFEHQSVNTSGFVMAVLLAEGLVQRDGQAYRLCDSAAAGRSALNSRRKKSTSRSG